MKTRTLKHIGNASVAAVALTLGPAAFAQSSSASQSYNQTQEHASAAQGEPSSSDASTRQRSPQASPSSTSDNSGSNLNTGSSVNNGTSSNHGTDSGASPMVHSGAAQYGAQSPDPQYGAPSAGAARFGSKDASSTASMASSQTSQIRVAANEDNLRTTDKLKDKKLRGSDGNDLGKIKDFLIDPQSGKVCFAIVSSGGVMGIGDTLHVVPYDLLKHSGDRDFTVAMTQSEWKQSPGINEDKFEEGRISLDSQTQQQISQAFSSSQVKANSDQLLRASKITGRDLVANNQEIGKIEGIVLQNDQMTASALVDPNDEFVHSEHKFLVPLDRLQITAGGNDKVMASLTREDFRDASQSVTAATASSTKVRSNEQSQDVSQGTAVLTPSATALSAGNSSVAATPRSSASSGVASNSGSSGSSATGTSSLSAGMNANPQPSTTEPAPGDDSGFAAPATQNSTSSSVATADRKNSTNSDSLSNSPSDRTSATSSSSDAFASNANPSASSHPQQNGPDSSSASASANTQTPSLSPTGSTSDDQNLHASGALVSEARAIRQALDNDPSTSQADVTVTPGNGKITLKGMVKDESTKSKIEKAARQAAHGVEVESNLNVQDGNQ